MLVLYLQRAAHSEENLEMRPTKQFLQVMSGEVARPISPLDAIVRNAEVKPSHPPSQALQGMLLQRIS